MTTLKWYEGSAAIKSAMEAAVIPPVMTEEHSTRAVETWAINRTVGWSVVRGRSGVHRRGTPDLDAEPYLCLCVLRGGDERDACKSAGCKQLYHVRFESLDRHNNLHRALV